MEDFYREEGGARKSVERKKRNLGLRPLLLVVEGKGKYFTKQIASFSSVRRTDNFISVDQKIPNCWLRLHFWGRWKLHLG